VATTKGNATRRTAPATGPGRRRGSGTKGKARAAPRPGARSASARRRRGQTGARRPESVVRTHRGDLTGLAVLTVGILLAIALYGAALGPVGHALDVALGVLIGWPRFLVPPVCAVVGVAVLAGRWGPDPVRGGVGGVLGLLSVCGLAELAGGSPGLGASSGELSGAGGWLGVMVGRPLGFGIGTAGSAILLGAVALAAIILATGVTVRQAGQWVAEAGRWARPTPRVRRPNDAPPDLPASGPTWYPTQTVPTPLFDAEPERSPSPADGALADPTGAGAPATGGVGASSGDEAEAAQEPAGSSPPAGVMRVGPSQGDWHLPAHTLLGRSPETEHDERAVQAAGEELVRALGNHGVETRLVGRTVGPTVTRFELELGAGVKVARVTSLSKDIAYAMASPDVRILAPIPGKSAIGVEVPNRRRELVALGDLLASPEWRRAVHPLEVALGRDIAGHAVLVNLAAMPHVLISGATGAGKSSCINSLLTSILMRSTPRQVRLILIDPKRVELGQYNELPHLLTPVVVDPKKAANALDWAVKEMEHRYDVLAEHGLRDISGYHEALERGDVEVGPEDDWDAEMPFILVVVDELNDLMMVAARDVEESVCRIAQMARAVGIHLVLATQRPSVDVITGVIKANIPSRMAFAVSSLADSRVILDQPGAERLIGKGDMLLLTASSSVPRRVQGPWVSEGEVRAVTSHWRRERDRNRVEQVVGITGSEDDPLTAGAPDDGGGDELLEQAMRIVVESQLGSTSMLQRKLRVGFARAGRIMDLLERRGVVGPSEGSKARTVLMRPEELERRDP